MTITPTPAHALATTNGTSRPRSVLEADMSQRIRVRVRRAAARRAPLSELDLRTPSGRLLPY